MFLSHQYESKLLPPTSEAFCQTLRMNAIRIQWKSSKLTLRSPSHPGCFWDDKNGLYDPVMTEFSPAPQSINKLNMYKCTRDCLKKNGFLYISSYSILNHGKILKKICVRKVLLLIVKTVF